MARIERHREGLVEDINVHSSVAIRTEAGVAFGTLRRVDGHQLTIQSEASIPVDVLADLRMETGNAYGSIFFQAWVVRRLVTAPSEPLRYILKISYIGEDERRKFGSWLLQAHQGGTLSDLSDVRTHSEVVESGMRQATDAERRAMLERMSQHPGMQSKKNDSDPFGLRSDVKDPGSRRESMRDALKNAARTRAGVPAEPASPASFDEKPTNPGLRSTPPAASSVSPASQPTVSPPVSPTAPTVSVTASAPVRAASKPEVAKPDIARRHDPTYRVLRGRGVPVVEVTWSAAEVFRTHNTQQLQNYILMLPVQGEALPDRPPVEVLLVYGRLSLQCPATVLQHTPAAVTYRLLLEAPQVDQLRKA